MTYKIAILLVFSIIADFIIGSYYPGTIPLFSISAVFLLAKALDAPEALFYAILIGFLLDSAQFSGTVYATSFLMAEVLAVNILSKKIIDLSNQLIQALFILVIFLVKIISGWLIFERAWPSVFLQNNLVVSLIVFLLTSLTLFIYHAKKT